MTERDPKSRTPWLTIHVMPPERLAPWWIYVAAGCLILGVFFGIWSVTR